MSLPRLFVIDDEAALAEFAADVAEQNGFEVQKFTDAALFLQNYDDCAEVIMLDLMMPDIDGVEIIRYLAGIQSDASIILMSGFDSGVLHSAQKLATEHKLNIVGTLSKPFRFKELNELLRSISIQSENTDKQKFSSAISAKELENAINNDELVVHYQPKINVNGYSIASVEALVRWQHPEKGLVPPGAFIPIAEEHDLIDSLTLSVLKQSMMQCRQWLEQGLKIQVAVNMSAHTFKDLALPDKLEKLMILYGLSSSQLALEITETALMQELVTSLDILTRLRMKGISLSIDDFGTGYSSLVQLHRVPFSEIKIDQSFVSEMEKDTEAAAIVETIIMLGRKLNMKTVAEGVETKACQKRLTELGCDQLQGFLFSKPIPGDEIFAWFSK